MGAIPYVCNSTSTIIYGMTTCIYFTKAKYVSGTPYLFWLNDSMKDWKEF